MTLTGRRMKKGKGCSLGNIFLHCQFLSLSFWREGRGRWAILREQIKSRDLKEHFHKDADNSASYSLPSAFHFCLNHPGIWDNFLSVLSLSPFALGKQPICSFMDVCPAFPPPGLCPHHSFHQVPLSLSPSVSQSEPSEKPSLLSPPLL